MASSRDMAAEMAIDTTFSDELAQLEELETELSRMHKDRYSDSDSLADSTTSTHSVGSSNSSPLNNGNATATTTIIASASAAPSWNNQTSRGSGASSRFGISRPILPRRAHSTLEHSRVSTSSTGSNDSMTKKMSSAEARKAYAQSVKARMSENGNVDDDSLRARSMPSTATRARSGSASSTHSNASSSSSRIPPPTPVPELIITPSILLTPQRRRDSIASSTSSVSSIASTPSNASTRSSTAVAARYNRTRSLASGYGAPASAPGDSRSSHTSHRSSSSSRAATTMASGRGGGGVSPGKTTSVIPPPRVSVMQKLLQASNADAKDARVDADLVKQLKQQYVLAEQGVQQLLKPATSTSSTMLPSSSPLRGAEGELRRLKSGIKTLSEHSVALMLACEVLQRQQDEQQDELAQVKVMNDQLLGEVESLSATATTVASTVDVDVDVDASPPTLERRLSAESSLSVFVNEMLRAATEKIEEKWKARFAEKLAEHEHALEVEHERATASILSNSRLVAETKHEKEDELKVLRDETVALQLVNKQLTIETTSLQQDLEFFKSQLDVQDDARSSSSFWEKTTDLAKRNRALTEEVAAEKQNAKKLQEVVLDLRAQSVAIRQENDRAVRRIKELETEKQLLEDRLVEAVAKVENEKTRREQFQVHVEQLTVENTALYAQMVALQATHEAKMEEARASFERRNAIVAGEVRALQAQNKLMRGGHNKDVMATTTTTHAVASTLSSTGLSVLSAEAQRELDSRLQQVTDELLTVRQELLVRTDQIAELEWQVAEGEVLRRKLHNTIQELRGNIRVHVRLRPFLRSDGDEALADAPRPAIRCDTFAGTLATNVEKQHTFAFDKVYGQSASQEAVFGDVADFIQSAMDGFNVCIFAYGQTGSGKTHTMQGSGKAQMRGIIPRALQLLIKTYRSLSAQGWQYSLAVTFYEIYNETIRDLLGPSSTMSVLSSLSEDSDRKLPIRTDKRGKTYVDGLRTVAIDFDVAEAQLDEIVRVAACNRSVDKTDMNAHSSRSHSIFGLAIRGVNEAQNTEVEGSLSLVDLAGSERLSRSHATGDRLKEAQAINKSLSALADVFQALAKKAAHVPYRNSKLTYALQPALSGDGKTLMMVNLSPTFASVEESVCSLRFAQNVSQCELGAPTRQIKARAGPSVLAAFTPTGTPTRPRSLTALQSTPPIAKKLQF